MKKRRGVIITLDVLVSVLIIMSTAVFALLLVQTNTGADVPITPVESVADEVVSSMYNVPLDEIVPQTALSNIISSGLIDTRVVNTKMPPMSIYEKYLEVGESNGITYSVLGDLLLMTVAREVASQKGVSINLVIGSKTLLYSPETGIVIPVRSAITYTVPVTSAGYFVTGVVKGGIVPKVVFVHYPEITAPQVVGRVTIYASYRNSAGRKETITAPYLDVDVYGENNRVANGYFLVTGIVSTTSTMSLYQDLAGFNLGRNPPRVDPNSDRVTMRFSLIYLGVTGTSTYYKVTAVEYTNNQRGVPIPNAEFDIQDGVYFVSWTSRGRVTFTIYTSPYAVVAYTVRNPVLNVLEEVDFLTIPNGLTMKSADINAEETGGVQFYILNGVVNPNPSTLTYVLKTGVNTFIHTMIGTPGGTLMTVNRQWIVAQGLYDNDIITDVNIDWITASGGFLLGQPLIVPTYAADVEMSFTVYGVENVFVEVIAGTTSVTYVTNIGGAYTSLYYNMNSIESWGLPRDSIIGRNIYVRVGFDAIKVAGTYLYGGHHYSIKTTRKTVINYRVKVKAADRINTAAMFTTTTYNSNTLTIEVSKPFWARYEYIEMYVPRSGAFPTETGTVWYNSDTVYSGLMWNNIYLDVAVPGLYKTSGTISFESYTPSSAKGLLIERYAFITSTVLRTPYSSVIRPGVGGYVITGIYDIYGNKHSVTVGYEPYQTLGLVNLNTGQYAVDKIVYDLLKNYAFHTTGTPGSASNPLVFVPTYIEYYSSKNTKSIAGFNQEGVTFYIWRG